MALPVETRVSELEDLLAELLRVQAETQVELDLFSRETRAALGRMEADTATFKHEALNFQKDMNKKWGDLANRLGTLAEDLVAPSIPRILREVTGCSEELESMAVRVIRRHPADRSQTHEFDVVAVCGDFVLINETKPHLIQAYIDRFVETLSEARAYLP